MVIPVHDANPTSRRPIVTLAIIVVCFAVFALVQPRGGDEAEFLYERAAIPCELSQGRPLTVGELSSDECGAELGSPFDAEIFPSKNVWLGVLWSMFLHGSWIHLLGNLLFLWVFGNNLEDLLGHVGFLAFYLLGGLAAAAVHVVVDTGSVVPVIGASGAIAAVMGTYLVLWPRARVTVLVPFLLFFPLQMPAFAVLLLWFGLQFLTDPNSGVAWAAHVGGFAFGVAAAWLVFRHVRPPPLLPFGGTAPSGGSWPPAPPSSPPRWPRPGPTEPPD